MILSSEKAAEGRVRVYRNATLSTPQGEINADVAVEGCRVAYIGQPELKGELPTGAIEVDARGLSLSPGAIDLFPGVNDDDKAILQGITTRAVTSIPSEPLGANVVQLIPWNALDGLSEEEQEKRIDAGMDSGAFGVAASGKIVGDKLLRLLEILAERRGCLVVNGTKSPALPSAAPAGCVVYGSGNSTPPAQVLALDRNDAPRGILLEGCIADLVLRSASGQVIEVLVGGTPVVEAGIATEASPGRVLRHPLPAHRAVVPEVECSIDRTGSVCLNGLRIIDAAAKGLAEVQALLGEPLPEGVPVETCLDASLPAEGFRVNIDSQGVRVSGGTSAGILHGVLLLEQLRDPLDRSLPVPYGEWTSSPAYEWRGMMLDVARHFRPAEDICRLIELLARHRLNVLHLHLTDDQGWRYEVPGWPRLTEVGGRRSHTQLGHGPSSTIEPAAHEGWYTTEDLRRIVAYGEALGVTIVPEVELVGHVQAAIAAYPELGNNDTAIPLPTEPWPKFGLNPHTLNLEESTLKFCRDAIDALIDVFPSKFIGFGGDEVPVTEWAASHRVAERMSELSLQDIHDVQPWYTAQLAAHVFSRGRVPYAWDEVLAGHIPSGILIGAWRGPVASATAVNRGFACVACPDLEAYLDYRQSESIDEPVPVGPPLTVEGTWALTVPDGCIGGQANVWTEHLRTRDQVDYATFPRLCSIAERLWTGGRGTLEGFEDFERRLDTHFLRLAAWGVGYRPRDGPRPAQRKPGVPGVPRTRAHREAVVAKLVEDLLPKEGER